MDEQNQSAQLSQPSPDVPAAPMRQPVDPVPSPRPSLKKLNWKGFFIAIIAVIVIEVVAVNLLHMDEPKVTKPATAKPPISSSPTKQSVDKLHAQTTSLNYLSIPTWKVRLQITSDLANIKLGKVIVGTAYSQTDQSVLIVVPELDASWSCAVDENGVKGTIGQIARTSSEKRTGPYQPLASKKLGNYTYTYEATTKSNCTKDPKYAELVKSFTQAFSSLGDY